ncbi:hypothetical protein GCM10010124_05030 [Pilimelia terevasa]|uniref:YbaB/EbfC DNA-binding family protein n=1 Tax=Pilimelia terevasa TaxID=53372 RepID=A0A8J3BHJ8_9ACTN|nr:YbaB/EbfC family nucleoid-associated protein [Pilimelia terevasa]GGK15344.1 hypothetical protein GCM10010124_05030 [Pilimelia terevasa]
MRSSGGRDADRALAARVDGTYARFQRIREGAEALRRELSSLRVSVSSPDACVRATVDARGRLVDLHLDGSRCVGIDPAILARLITATVGEAAAQATAQVRSHVAAQLPESPAAPDLLADGDASGLLGRYAPGGPHSAGGRP